MIPEKTKALDDHNSYPPSSGTSHVWHCSDGVPKLQLSVNQQLALVVGSLETQIPAARASHNDHSGCKIIYNHAVGLHAILSVRMMQDVNHMANFGALVLSHMVDDLMGFPVRILGFPPAAHFTKTTSMHQSSMFNWLIWFSSDIFDLFICSDTKKWCHYLISLLATSSK